MSDHPWNDWRITAYVLGDLDDDARAAFERELSADPRLREAVAEATRITRAASDALGREPAPTLSDARRAEIFSHSSGEPPMKTPAPPPTAGRRGMLLLSHLAVAASVGLLVGGAVWFTTRSGPRHEIALLGRQDAASEQAVRSADDAGTAAPTDGAAATRGRRVPAARSQPGSDASKRFAGPVEAPVADEGDQAAGGYFADAGGYEQPARGRALDGIAGMGGGMGGMGGGTIRQEKEFYDYRESRLATAPGGEQLRRLGEPQEGRPGGLYGEALGLALPSQPDRGRGPGRAGDRYDPITDNPFLRVLDNPRSTFSIDVDTASYSKVRQYVMQQNQLPRPDAVRIEELVNYFDYDYAPPVADAEHPFAAHLAVAGCPWNPEHRLARIAIKGRTVERDQRPPSNLVFLLDVSGSMNQPNKLPLVKRSMRMLIDQLDEDDRVAIIVYAGAAGMVLDSTPADRQPEIHDAIERLQAGGSTNGGQGIQLAYATARDHFIDGGTNRVVLCTDGDFNVGTTGTDELVRMVEKEAAGGVFLSVLGFGMGNHNDAMLEQISGRGNGNYAFIDTDVEARKVLVEQIAGTLVTIAKDVKIQVEFNPSRVAGYRLIGYENRLLATEDFNDDTKDAGEIGAGHSVTALYELVPAGEPVESAAPDVAPLKYQTPASLTEAAESDELLTLNLRYKQPDGDESTLVEFPAEDSQESLEAADDDFQFAAAVAGFGMLLRDSPYKGNWTYAAVEEIAGAAQGEDPDERRGEFLRMVRRAAELAGE